MRELRRDPIIGRWVIISTERAKRPSDFAVPPLEQEAEVKSCPFCEGNESMTLPEILAVRDPASKPNGPGWKIRIIPSVSGFLNIAGDLDRHGDGIYDIMNGIGTHEIIVMTPKHGLRSYEIDNTQFTNMVEIGIRRIKDLKMDERLKYALVFQNYGREAGGSGLGHLNLQVIATPATPKRVKEELDGAKAYFNYKDRCIFCDMIKQELSENARVILQTDGFLAINPFCSRFPFETWVLPTRHSCDFDTIEKPQIEDFGNTLREVFRRMYKILGDFSYNAILHTAPFRRRRKKGYWETLDNDYHWHVEIMPRLTRVAGFEWGSGFYINPMPPEDACKYLKEE